MNLQEQQRIAQEIQERASSLDEVEHAALSGEGTVLVWLREEASPEAVGRVIREFGSLRGVRGLAIQR